MFSLLEMNDLLFPPSFPFGTAAAVWQIAGNNFNSSICHIEIHFQKNGRCIHNHREQACQQTGVHRLSSQ